MKSGLARLRDNLAGAWALMWGNPKGLELLDTSLEGFWRSFAALLPIAPFALLAFISQQRLAQDTGEAAPSLSPVVLGPEGLALLIDWLAFPLVFALLARPLGLGPRYVPYIVARNWASVIITALVAIVHGLHLLGVLPSHAVPAILLAGVVVALRFSYMIARTTLLIGMGLAAPIVLLDLLVSLTVWAAFDRLI